MNLLMADNHLKSSRSCSSNNSFESANSSLIVVHSSTVLPIAKWRVLSPVGCSVKSAASILVSSKVQNNLPADKNSFQEESHEKGQMRKYPQQCRFRERRDNVKSGLNVSSSISSSHSRGVANYLMRFYEKPFGKIIGSSNNSIKSSSIKKTMKPQDSCITTDFFIRPLAETFQQGGPLLQPLVLKESHVKAFSDFVFATFSAFLFRGKEAKFAASKHHHHQDSNRCEQQMSIEGQENLSQAQQAHTYKTSLSTILTSQEVIRTAEQLPPPLSSRQDIATRQQIELEINNNSSEVLEEHAMSSSPSQQSQFHNLKNSFMHLLIQLFNSDVMDCFTLPRTWTQEAIRIVERMKSHSIKHRPVKGSYQYYSNTHYAALFQRISEESLSSIQLLEHTNSFHKLFFGENILTSTTTATNAITRCNFYKEVISSLVEFAIETAETQLTTAMKSMQISSNRFAYIAKVKKGITKLRQGKQVIRF